MSAWVVSREHIDVMVALAIEGPSARTSARRNWFGPSWAQQDPFEHSLPDWRRVSVPEHAHPGSVSPNELGDLLVLECVRSVSYRYPDDGPLPGPVDPYWIEGYSYRRPAYIPTAVEGLKTIDCYVYQSCEHAGWARSEASRFCQALARALVSELDGYDAAPWGWSAELIEQRLADDLLGRRRPAH